MGGWVGGCHHVIVSKLYRIIGVVYAYNMMSLCLMQPDTNGVSPTAQQDTTETQSASAEHLDTGGQGGEGREEGR